MGDEMVKRIMLIVLITIAFVTSAFLIKPLIIKSISQSLSSLYISNSDDISNFEESVSEPVPTQHLPTPEPKPVVSTITRELEVLRLVNIERQKDGVNPLTYMIDLEKGADIRALEIKELWSHTRPDGTVFFTAFDYIRYSKIGENLAAGPETPQEAVSRWMKSFGHRQNILDETYEQMAMSISEDEEGRLFWVQIFYRGK
jgi:uncharacterized protein YkwD